MPYYKFKNNDVYNNTLKAYPSIKFVIYSGSAYYNDNPSFSGSFADPIIPQQPGQVSLYEMNVDRSRSDTGRFIGPADLAAEGDGIQDTGLIYSFVSKNGSRLGFRSMATTASWNEALYGTPLYGNYPYTSSISKEFYSANTPRSASAPTWIGTPGDPGAVRIGSVSHLLALKNTINYYGYVSPEFAYSSSARDFNEVEIGLVNIPTIFYGSSIKKGTVDLKYYITGTLLAQAKDENKNGLLRCTYGTSSVSGSVVGLVLYDEGILILTSSDSLSLTSSDYYTGPTLPGAATSLPRWTYFAQSLSGSVLDDSGPGAGPGPAGDTGLITAASASFIMEMRGMSKTQTLTMFASARKGQLNQSNNPTFLKYSENNYASTGSKAYFENDKMQIKNVVSSSFPDPTGSFEKTTYISKVGVYDENKNLIAIAKVATPVKKTVERDFTFKIKLDI
jgi:hypothetical protein